MSNPADYSNEFAASARASAFGRKCNAAYKKMARRLKLKHDPEAVLKWTRVVAGFAWTFHAGRYADGSLENPLLEIGRRLEEAPQPDAHPARHPAKRRVLHVATTLYDIGGHSRLITNWIHNDKSSEHSLLLTDQEGDIPQWMMQAVAENGGELISLPAESTLLKRAHSLRVIAQSGFDLVVLHHHPNDVVPVVAFASEDCPPVVAMNHADHVFWLGSTVADLVLNVRGFGECISATRRFAQRNLLLPLPLSIPFLSVTKAEARRRFNIPQEQTVLLSIGTRYKFTRTETHDFFATVAKILAQNPAAHLYIIGISREESHEHLERGKDERLHFLGKVEDPTLYRLAADIYLDSMPYGSLTALLETAALGVCPVLMYAPPAPQYDISEDVGFSGLVTCAPSEAEYIATVNRLIQQPNLTREIGAEVRGGLLSHHQGEKWSEYLADVYETLQNARHHPVAIPDTEFMETVNDLALCDFNSARYSDISLIRRTVEAHFNALTLKDMISLFLISLSVRDLRFSYKETRLWLLMFASKLLR
ncbi:MAG TPA: glycosyltransferase [Pyrinomonadaceae bacterium]|jgi:hypothetical protein